jgi:arginyl-tRNA--protein-N-Asp/Glu arginylyltransferase
MIGLRITGRTTDMIGTPGTELVFINEEFYDHAVSRRQMDVLLADAWRHFGVYFFRYNLGIYGEEIRRVEPLRIRLADFKLSKSQRRILKRNADLRCEVRPIEITDESDDLFRRHKTRFTSGVPFSIYDFLSTEPASVPSDGSEIAVYDDERLIAVSYFDEGLAATSGIYAAFDPDLATRGLGVFTMLKEIEYSIETGREYYYPGFAYEGPSFYDYKKRFTALECFDWKGNWLPYKMISD